MLVRPRNFHLNQFIPLSPSSLRSVTMASWERLIRFEDSTGTVRFGDVIISNDDSSSLSVLAARGELKARCLQGSNIFSLSPSAETVQVKKLLPPLSPSDVPIVKCVGLNYMKHSMIPGYRVSRKTRDLTTFCSQGGRPEPSTLSLHLHQAQRGSGSLRRRHPDPQARAGQPARL